MKRYLLLLGMMLLGLTVPAASAVELEPREWLINGQAMNQSWFTATFVKYENGFVDLRLPNGFIRKVPAAQINDGGLWYIQSVLSQIPEKISSPKVNPDQKLLVDISAENLPLGPIKQWTNKGALGGAFHALRTPLTVKLVGGVKAVNFYFGPWAVPLEFQAMVSDFYSPKSLIEDGPYTVAAWVYSPSPLGIDTTRESVLSWHALDGDRDGTDFGYGTAGRYSVETRGGSGAYGGPLGSYPFSEEIFPAMNQWHHIAWVYSGPAEGKFQVYIDGRLSIDKDVKSNPIPSGEKLMFLGCNWSAGRGTGCRPQSFFTGAIDSLKVYASAMDAEGIRKLYGRPVAAPMKFIPQVATPAKEMFKSYFTEEFDGLVSEPFPAEIRQSGEYGKLMEGWGQPVIGRDRCPDEAMRRCAYTMAKTMQKRPDITNVLEALDVAARLDDVGPPWLGFVELTTACYGQARSFFADPGFYWGSNIMVHEMGHQFHMWGGEQTENDFRDRLFNIFWQNKMDGLWSGDYGGLNMWEYMACAASAYCSDGTEDDVMCRRELFRGYDPRMFYFLQPYWPGDKLIELLPGEGMNVDASGKVTSWANSGGLEFWGKFALKKYPWTTGEFVNSNSLNSPKVTSPTLTTVNGVSAVKFGVGDGLSWNKTTRECLIENKAWSVELWAYRDKKAAGDEVLLRWGSDEDTVKVLWGAGKTALDCGNGRTTQWVNKPSAGKWHHLVFVFMGGGLENGEGRVKVWVDGKIDHIGALKLNIPSNQVISLGARLCYKLDRFMVEPGFSGSLAHVRVHDYDLGDLQLQKHYAEENGYYKRENLQVADALLVDLDARALATCPEYQSRPLYPKSTGKDWLRAWTNRGTLGGKMTNDAMEPLSSYPKRADVAGITAITFTKDNTKYTSATNRMVSMFVPSKQMLASPALTFGAWVYRTPADKGGAVFQWGGVTLNSKSIKPGKWQNAVMVVKGGKASIYVDGKLITTEKATAPKETDRLHFGARRAGAKWADFFSGAIANFRVHAGALTNTQIAANIAASDMMLASHPIPAVGDRVAAERKPVLSWNSGVKTTSQTFDIYVSTDPAQVATGKKGGPAYAGKFKKGAFAPKLAPGKTYYWRVDGLDAAGNAIAKGPVWSFATYEGLLVDLDAAKLTEGKLSEWKNNGRAGGKFVKGALGDQPAPRVENWQGRKGVSFFGNKYLTSSFRTPESLTGNSPFSVSIWVYNNELLDRATMLSWGDSKSAPVEFAYGRGTDAGAFANGSLTVGYGGEVTKPDVAHYNAPLLTFWQNITYTYSGGPDGTLKIYVNGILNQEKKIALNVSSGGRISVGALVDELANRQSPFAGFISDVSIYGYPLSNEEATYLYDGSGAEPNESKMLVKLSSDDLPTGKLMSWKNQGTLGGQFTLLPQNPSEPTVETVAGRKAVTFDGKDDFMSSTIITPATVTGINPVTIESWVYNPEVGRDETYFTLAPREAFQTNYLEYTINRSLEMRYCRGRNDDPGAVSANWGPRNLGWPEGNFPEAGKWHHVAFVYDGQHQGWARVYADGKLVTKRGFYTICTNDGMPMFLGTAWNTDRGLQDMFTGSLASLRVYDYAKTDAEIAKAAQAQ